MKRYGHTKLFEEFIYDPSTKQIERINFSYTDNGTFYSTYVYFDDKSRIKLSLDETNNELLTELKINMTIPRRLDSEHVDKVVKKVDDLGITCNWDDSFDPS